MKYVYYLLILPTLYMVIWCSWWGSAIVGNPFFAPFEVGNGYDLDNLQAFQWLIAGLSIIVWRRVLNHQVLKDLSLAGGTLVMLGGCWIILHSIEQRPTSHLWDWLTVPVLLASTFAFGSLFQLMPERSSLQAAHA